MKSSLRLQILVFVISLGEILTEFDQIIWECNTFDEEDPLGSCGLGHPHVHWGVNNIRAVSDPAGGGTVLRIAYPSGSCVRNVDNRGGIQFRCRPFPARASLRLQYDVMFSENFDFVKGGKLPGLWGGTGSCSGGTHEKTCFSSRFMWRAGGDLEVYAYLPVESGHWFCSNPHVHCNFNYGHSFGRGTGLELVPGRWHTVAQELSLNSPNRADGRVALFLDGTLWFELKGLKFREDSRIMIDSLYFSTFFGGGDMSWASTDNVYIYFKNIKVLT